MYRDRYDWMERWTWHRWIFQLVMDISITLTAYWRLSLCCHFCLVAATSYHVEQFVSVSHIHYYCLHHCICMNSTCCTLVSNVRISKTFLVSMGIEDIACTFVKKLLCFACFYINRTDSTDSVTMSRISFVHWFSFWLGRPTYLSADLGLTAILLSSFASFYLLCFRPLPSELAERSSTKTRHMLGTASWK